MQPDTIIPDLSNPQSWNRFSYVRNSPVKFSDPTGHREVSGCSELAGGCHVTQDTIDEDLGKANSFRITTEQNKCKAGEKQYCSYAQNHPGEVMIFGVTGLVGGAALEVFILGGGAISALEAASGLAYKGAVKAMTACLMSSLCQQLLPKTYDPRVEGQTDAFHNFPRLLDPIIMKSGNVTQNGPYINYATEGSVELGGKVYAGVYQIGVKIIEWAPTIVHHLF